MATVAKLHVSPPSLRDHQRTDHRPRFQPFFHRSPATLDAIPVPGQPNLHRRISLQPCRSFRSENGRESVEKETGKARKDKNSKQTRLQPKKRTGALYSLKSIILKLSGSRPPLQGECRDAVAKAEEFFFSVATQVGRYLVTMTSTGVILAIGFHLSGGDNQMNTLIWYSWLGGIVIGTMVGANMVLEEHCRAGPRNVVITGSTRGLGKALAREFLLSGDRVVVASRSPESVHKTVAELEESLKEGILKGSRTYRENMAYAKVVGIDCDVCNPDDVRRLSNFAVNELGSIDIWTLPHTRSLPIYPSEIVKVETTENTEINNAGTNKGFRPLLQFTDEDVEQIVSTNLTGSLICTREAMHVMRSQENGGHIFNMDGAGSGGSSTPLTAVYGATKCGLRQFQASLLKECKRSKVGVHTASPGMVLTDLLLSGSTLKNKQMFNIICELPETVARTLVPRMRVVKGTGKAINYLTPPRILIALVTAWLRRGRWFDDQGRALYAAEADRIRNWAESRAQFSFTDAMEMYTDNTWFSVFSLSVVCAFIILSSSGSTLPGT